LDGTSYFSAQQVGDILLWCAAGLALHCITDALAAGHSVMGGSEQLWLFEVHMQ
jgi:hypothetical protein